MKFNIMKKDLSEGLNSIGRVMGGNTTLPILKGFIMSAADNKITLFATNIDTSIKISIKAEILEEGEIVVAEGKLFSDIVKKLPKEEILIEQEENSIKIKSGRSKSTVSIMNTDDYPKAPEFQIDKDLSLQGDILIDMINKSVFAVSNETVRPILTGICFEIKSNILKVVALDGFRVAYNYTRVNSEDFIAILPGKGALEISRSIDSGSEITLNFGNNHCLLTSENKEITVRLLEGEFMKYDSIIPSEHTKVVEINKKAFIDALERATILATDEKIPVKFTLENSKLKISCISKLGNLNEHITVEDSNEELFEIAFNSKLLLDGLKNFNSENIKLQFSGSISPLLVDPCDEIENFKYLCLPVRIAK